MKKITSLFLMLLTAAVVFTSCKEEEKPNFQVVLAIAEKP